MYAVHSGDIWQSSRADVIMTIIILVNWAIISPSVVKQGKVYYES